MRRTVKQLRRADDETRTAVTLRYPHVCPRAAILVAAVALSGCGSAPRNDLDDESAEISGLTAAQPLSGDLVTASAQQGDGDGEVLAAPGDPGTGGAPKVFYLNYADGRALPRTNPNPCNATAPKFRCEFASSLVDCQKQIQAYLDKWYADFNIVFTLTRPTSGSFYTEVVSSGGGAWCNAADNVAGVAPFLCDDLAGGVAYTFSGGKSAKETAIIIAQEQAHLVGLEHTLSTRDIMDPTICPNCDGFENVDNKIQKDQCGRSKQNSYDMMRDRLGMWTGGIKPTVFGCQADAVAPLVQILAPSNNAAVAESFALRVQASDDCKVSRVSVTVAPMGLHAQSTTAPFEWTLTKIVGRQTITVTAVDPAGKQSSATVVVNAGGAMPVDGGVAGDGSPSENGGDPGAGCDLGGCDVAGGGAGDHTHGRTPAVLMWSAALLAISLSVMRRRRAAVRAATTSKDNRRR
jgi:hypothetical protein